MRRIITSGFYNRTSSFWGNRQPSRKKSIAREYSTSKRLKKENKINDEFEIMLDNLSLEEIIALKLETSSKIIGGKLFGLPLWFSLTDITRDAVFKYACSGAKTQKEAARFLGLNWNNFYRQMKRYSMGEFFGYKEQKKDGNKEDSNKTNS